MSYRTLQSAEDVARIIAEQTEAKILEQLEDFVKRDLIELEVSDVAIVQNPFSAKLEVRRNVSLRLKDREYIERLEKENADFKKALEHLK